ncbi:MAG: sugar kinase [Paracoccaceae bacterium]
MNIGCIGEAMIELSLSHEVRDAKVGFAGDTLNTAIYMRRALSAEHTVSFISLIGTDKLSDRMATFIENEGVSTLKLGRHPERLPGIYAIRTDESGERSFLYWRENSAARCLFQSGGGYDFSLLDGFDALYFSAITLAILPAEARARFFAWIESYRTDSGIIAFDSNYRSRLWNNKDEAIEAVTRAWKLTDIALPSVDDEMELFGDKDEDAVINRLLSYGIKSGVLKRGADGPIPLVGEIEPTVIFSPVEHVVDTTAAGDSFVGAFLASYLIEKELSAAMVAGHKQASRVIQHSGAVIPKNIEMEIR